jgi:two-component system chemotaxis response regulator CheY
LKSVLVVDDSFFMRKLIITYLERHDFTIAGQAENGESAVAQYIEFRPDIVTLDITMPIMDGLETLKQIIKIDKSARVIMMSSMGQELMVMESVKSGAKHFIVKPFKEQTVIDIISEVLESKQET